MKMRERAHSNVLKSFYTVKGKLGKGGQGSVTLVRRKKDGMLFACKTFAGITREHARTERGALKKLKGYKGVVSLIECLVDQNHYNMILERCECSLEDLVHLKMGLSPREAALIIRDLAEIVEHIHSQGIVHRDIKLANILVTSEQEPYRIKLADFGCARMFKDKDCAKTMRSDIGTERYTAPEVGTERDYNESVDVWGIGIVLYEMLSGKLAFGKLESKEVQKRLRALEDLPVSSMEWCGFTFEAVVFIQEILCLQPEKRLTLQQIKNHPWVVRHCTGESRSHSVRESVERELHRQCGKEDTNMEQQKPQMVYGSLKSLMRPGNFENIVI